MNDILHIDTSTVLVHTYKLQYQTHMDEQIISDDKHFHLMRLFGSYTGPIILVIKPSTEGTYNIGRPCSDSHLCHKLKIIKIWGFQSVMSLT